jgi:hypothetical protein
MNVIRKTLKQQKKSALWKLKNTPFKVLHDLISQPKLLEIIQEESTKYRNRLYAPMQTLCMFISQAISSDSSCQKVVNEMALFNSSQSVATGGYCKARQRLNETMVSKCVKTVAKSSLHDRVKEIV